MPAVKKEKKSCNGIVLRDRPYRIEDGVTQSLIQSWKECRYGCSLRLGGWQPDATREVLSFGTMVHWFLEHLYKDPYEFIPEWRQKEIEDEGLTGEEFVKWSVARFFNPERVSSYAHDYSKTPALAQLSEENMETAAMANPLVEQYIEHWAEEDAKYEWVGLEKLFDVDFRGYRLRGKIDGIFRRPDGKLWIFETKTKGQISPEDIGRALKFDFQSLFYVTAVEIMLGEPVVGVKYNVLRRTQLRRRANEPSSDFYRRVADDIKERPDFYYYRTEAVFTQERKDYFKEELDRTLREFKAWLKGELGTYRNETNCTMRKWNCDFLSACASYSMAGYNDGRVMFSELDE